MSEMSNDAVNGAPQPPCTKCNGMCTFMSGHTCWKCHGTGLEWPTCTHGVPSYQLCPIARYDAWLAEKIAAGDHPVLEELDRLTARFVRDECLVLVCWCKPADCHGDIIARVIRGRSAAFLAQRS
jgi:hypothetical protein